MTEQTAERMKRESPGINKHDGWDRIPTSRRQERKRGTGRAGEMRRVREGHQAAMTKSPGAKRKREKGDATSGCIYDVHRQVHKQPCEREYREFGDVALWHCWRKGARLGCCCTG